LHLRPGIGIGGAWLIDSIRNHFRSIAWRVAIWSYEIASDVSSLHSDRTLLNDTYKPIPAFFNFTMTREQCDKGYEFWWSLLSL
jgi:hypothetical protein